MTKIGIFIPCYNVEKSIRGVLESFSEEVLKTVAEIVVTDNCSTDQTLSILHEIQSQPILLAEKLVIIKNKKNYGLGGTQKIAFQYFIDHHFSHFMIIHGDGQGNGEVIAQRFLKTYREHPNVDWILASRFTKGADVSKYNRMRTMGNHFFNFVTFLLTGHNMSDSGTAIIYYRVSALEQFPFWHLTNSFQFNLQLNILCYNAHLKAVVVPLHWGDSRDESNIKALNYCKTLLSILLRYRFNKSIRRKVGWEMFEPKSQQFSPSFIVVKKEKKELSHGLL